MTLNSNAQSVTLHPGDGRSPVTLRLDDLKPVQGDPQDAYPGAYSVDRDNNKIMLAWDGNMGNTGGLLRLIIGPSYTGHNNTGLCMQDVVRIVVNATAAPGPLPSAPGAVEEPEEEPEDEPEDGEALADLPTANVVAGEATEEQVAAVEEAVETAADRAATHSISMYPTGKPITVSGGETPTLTTISGVETDGTTVLAMLNEDGTLTPVPTRVNEDGTVTVLITGDVVLVPLHVEADFNDVSGHWGEADIKKAASLMIVEGVGGGDFSPRAEVTGAEAVTMFLRALGIPLDKDAPPVDGVDQDRWFADAINTAADNGLAVNIDPNVPMTRIQTAELIYSALELIGMKPSMTLEKATEICARFPDLGHLTNDQMIHMAVLVELGIFRGNANGTMSPDSVLQRAHMASLAVRFQELIFGE